MTEELYVRLLDHTGSFYTSDILFYSFVFVFVVFSAAQVRLGHRLFFLTLLK